MNSSGSSENNASDPPAVRILPPDGRHEIRRRSPEEDRSRRWLPAGLGVVAATLALLLVVTLPDRDVSTSTTKPTPLLSEFEATTVDLTTTLDTTLVDQWKTVDITNAAATVMYDLTLSQGMLIAVGSHFREPQAWVSSNGNSWRQVATLETPDNDAEFDGYGFPTITAAFAWHGGTIGIGMAGWRPGIWLADQPDTWKYLGTIDGFPEGESPVATAGAKLLAVAPKDRGYQGWVSDDGADWAAIGGLSGLNGMYLNSLEASAGWYYALGSGSCNADGCRPAIYRSGNGMDWTRAESPDRSAISSQPGEVHDMVAADSGYLAIGSVTVDDARVPAIWRSVDGATWLSQTINEGFTTLAAQLTLTSIDSGAQNRATIVVDGTQQVVVEDSVIHTDAGVVLITDVEETRVKLSVDGKLYRLDLGSDGTIQRTPLLHDVAAQGQRIVIAGRYESVSTLRTLDASPRPQSAAVWTSVDGGNTWERSLVAGDDSAASRVALIGNNIAVVGVSRDSAAAWHAYWNTDVAEAAAIEATHQLVATVNEGDAAALAQLVPFGAPGAPRFELPSLGGVSLDWWQGGTRDLDQQAMVDTLDYMTALGTEIFIEDCNTSVRLGEVDTVRVVCGFSVTSNLMRALGVPEGLGRFEANYQAGMLTSFELLSTPSLSAWQILSEWAAGTGAEMMGVTGISGEWERPPVFTADTAIAHMDLANQFIATMLTPGATRVAETPFGTMEWQWLETLPGGLSMVDSVTHSDLGFIAIGRESSESTSVSLWLSGDGLDWITLAAPEADWIWNLAPFRGGLIASGWRSDVPEIVIFDGEEWTSVPIPDAADNQSVAHVVPNGDSALVITTLWANENAPPEFGVMVLDVDNNLTRGDDFWIDEQNWPIGIAAMGKGYVVATTTGPASHFRVQYTEDGVSWATLTNSALPEGARHVWRMDRHGDSLLVFGQLDESRCTDIGILESCESAQAIWRSEDGVEWSSAVIGPDRPLLSELVGSGPLGLVAIGQLDFENPSPRPVYFSTTGEVWVLAENLALFEPAATWSWENLPAISEDTIIIPRVSFYEGNPTSSQSETEKYSLMVGRLIEE